MGMSKLIKVDDNIWSTLYNLRIANKDKSMNVTIAKLLHKELYEGLKLEEVKE
jgi:hypothetical protein